MQHARKTLSLKLPVSDLPPEETGSPGDILRRGVLLKLCVTATYNRTTMKLAPHALYTRHDDPFVDAVVLEREGKPPRETKLGAFKLAGLSEVRLTADRFVPQPVFDPAEPRYEGTMIAAVSA